MRILPGGARLAHMASSLAPATAGVGLGSLAALHLVWAFGWRFPARSRAELAEAVVGAPDMPSAAACVAVAAALGSAGAIAAGAGGVSPQARSARTLIGAGLVARGVLGAPAPGDTFRRWDARLYRPACLLLGAASLLSARRGVDARK